MLCNVKLFSKENAVNRSSITEEISHLLVEKKKYDVQAFTIINIGCKGLFQYEDIDGNSPIDAI